MMYCKHIKTMGLGNGTFSKFASTLLILTLIAMLSSTTALATGIKPLDPIFSSGKAINYSPYRGLGPIFGEIVSDENILEDLALLDKAGFNLIRLFESGANARNILHLAQMYYPHMKFVTGIPLNPFEDCNSLGNMNSVLEGIDLANDSALSNIVAVSVGNETVLLQDTILTRSNPRPDLPVSCVVGYIDQVKPAVQQPVSSTQLAGLYIGNFKPLFDPQDLLSRIDYVSVNIYPWFDTDSYIEQIDLGGFDWRQESVEEGPKRGFKMMLAAVNKLKLDLNRVSKAVYINNDGETVSIGDTLPIVISETGWKSFRSDNRKESPTLPVPLPTPVPSEFLNTVVQVEPYGATPANQRLYLGLVELKLKLIPALLDKLGYYGDGERIPLNVFTFQAFDEAWKLTSSSFSADDGWGLWNESRSPKEALCAVANKTSCKRIENDSIGYFPKQVTNLDPNVFVTPEKIWQSFVTAFPLDFAFNFGFFYDRQLFPARFGSAGPGQGQLVLRPNTEIYEFNSPGPNFWIDASGNGNAFIVASLFVENDKLIGKVVTFSGKTISNTLAADPITGIPYQAKAFVAGFIFPIAGGPPRVVVVNKTPLNTNTPFEVSLDTSGIVADIQPGERGVVQYGFELEGVIAAPSTIDSLGEVIIEVPSNTLPLRGHH